ncbi:tyrosine-type recombinase/integrase [Niallia sp. Sow4_A1]|uniref:Tyrosine-type recombinase/integrase n=1 Tax=Niallia hominis TaxID=3133173 RepID=A0ABV1F0W3_9BACI|nr:MULTISPECIES: tyrosine-type recombinase/integrase [Bacillaceae]MCM3363961.1 site-specific integrase [Niallia sp. MER TA 168]
MKKTNFALYLNKYFTGYLPNNCGSTPQTIDSYRYSFILFLTYMQDEHRISADKVDVSDLTRNNVVDYLNWLQVTRSNGISTRNQRQAALNSFIRFLMYEFPEHLDEYQKILGIPVKKAPQKEISYLKTDGVALLIEQVDLSRQNGLRDYLILSLLYTTGIRVSELIKIRIKDLSLQEPFTLLVHGKGQKSRYVPLMRNTIPFIHKYLVQKRYDKPEKLGEWLFKNHMNEPFTRQGINYIVGKYTKMARRIAPDMISADFSPHKMRHTTAMGLVESGVDLIYIRDLLGHVSVKTTEMYARADAMHKRLAIEAASKEIVPSEEAIWDNDSNLKDWLKSFNRR